MNIILGAGLSGLIAATQFPNARILEASVSPVNNHNALLRFRTDAIGKMVGIPFQAVTVTKGIWHNGDYHRPSIRLSNLYSNKVIGELKGRSIDNIDTVERYIAPPNFTDLLRDIVGNRVEYGSEVNADTLDGLIRSNPGGILSTIPLPSILKLLDIAPHIDFQRATIHVYTADIPNCKVHQTVYYPGADTAIYRASITGGHLVIEAMSIVNDFNPVWESFGIEPQPLRIQPCQRYGKISPIGRELGRHIVYSLTRDADIYSLGRFATWRNILLDDLVRDIALIKSLANSSAYERSLKSLKKV